MEKKKIKLDVEQKEAVKASPSSPLAVLAGPGSGKTTVISHRYAYLVEKRNIAPANILAVTFSTSMASEMKKRIKTLSASEPRNISTIHAFCFRFLKSIGEDKRDKAEEWWIKNSVKEVLTSMGWSDADWRSVRWWIDKSKMSGIVQSDLDKLHEYYSQYQPDHYAQKLAIATLGLSNLQKSQNKITFPDMLNDTWQLLQKKKYLKAAQERYKNILIDEAQDTPPITVDIFSLISPERMFVVGDPDQTLYRFTGADPEHNLFRFEDVVKLQTNYRCPEYVVSSSNRLIVNNYDSSTSRFVKKMKATSKVKGQIDVSFHETPDTEADWIAKKIVEEEIFPGGVFVGARTNSQLPYVERAFYKHNVPYVVMGDATFYNRTHIRHIVDYARMAAGPKTANTAFRNIYNVASMRMLGRNGSYSPYRWLGHQFLEDCHRANPSSYYQAAMKFYHHSKYGAGVKDLVNFVSSLERDAGKAPDHLINRIIKECYLAYTAATQAVNPLDPSNSDNIIEDIAVLLDMAKDYKDLNSFLAFVTKMQSEKRTEKKKRNSVILTTIHKLKGLERPYIFGIGMSEGLLPHRAVTEPMPAKNGLQVLNESTLKDERCIAFVLVTRAIEKLYLTSVQSWQGKPLVPSRFIKELLDDAQYSALKLPVQSSELPPSLFEAKA